MRGAFKAKLFIIILGLLFSIGYRVIEFSSSNEILNEISNDLIEFPLYKIGLLLTTYFVAQINLLEPETPKDYMEKPIGISFFQKLNKQYIFYLVFMIAYCFLSIEEFKRQFAFGNIAWMILSEIGMIFQISVIKKKKTVTRMGIVLLTVLYLQIRGFDVEINQKQHDQLFQDLFMVECRVELAIQSLLGISYLIYCAQRLRITKLDIQIETKYVHQNDKHDIEIQQEANSPNTDDLEGRNIRIKTINKNTVMGGDLSRLDIDNRVMSDRNIMFSPSQSPNSQYLSIEFEVPDVQSERSCVISKNNNFQSILNRNLNFKFIKDVHGCNYFDNPHIQLNIADVITSEGGHGFVFFDFEANLLHISTMLKERHNLTSQEDIFKMDQGAPTEISGNLETSTTQVLSIGKTLKRINTSKQSFQFLGNPITMNSKKLIELDDVKITDSVSKPLGGFVFKRIQNIIDKEQNKFQLSQGIRKIPTGQEKCLVEIEEVPQSQNFSKSEFEDRHDNFNTSLDLEEQQHNYINGFPPQPKRYIYELSFYVCPQKTNSFMCPVIMITMKDVSNNIQLRDMRKLQKMQEQTIGQIAHEMRTPLNCIIGMLENSVNMITGDIKNKMLMPALSSSQILSSFIHDLLDNAQNQAGKMEIFKQRFELRKLCQDIIGLMDVLAQGQQNKIVGVFSRDVPRFVYSDSFRIRQVITNLLSNSMKFTSSGKITLKIERAKDIQEINQRQQFLKISVEDNGIGIEPDKKKDLFKAFGKLEDKQGLNNQGVGLGLMISNKISLKLSNNFSGLKVISEGKGKGCTFYFYIQFDVKTEISKMIENDAAILQESYRPDDPQNSVRSKPETHSDQLQQVFQVGVEDTSNKDLKQVVSQNHRPVKPSKYSKKNLSNDFKQESSIKPEDIQQESCLSVQEQEQGQADFYQTQTQFSCFNDNQIDEFEDACACPKILVVDDDYFNCYALSFSLDQLQKSNQYVVSGAKCEEQVKQRYQNECCQSYQFIFMDIEMPEQDGFTTAQHVKEFLSEKVLSTVLIACSGHGDLQEREEFTTCGFQYSITQPIDRESLEDLVGQTMG